MSLHDAAYRGDVEMVRTILKEHPESVNQQVGASTTALQWAVGSNHKEVVELLLEYGADAQMKDVEGCDALQCATSHDNPEMLELLLQHGATIHSRDAYGMTPLHKAASRGYDQIVALLLSAGSDVE